MAITYEPIATATTTSGQTEVNFTNVPNTYTDIIAVASSGASATGQDFRVRVGAGAVDTGENYSSIRVGSNRTVGTSAVASSFYGVNTNYIGSAFIAGFGNDQATSIFEFNYYANTLKQKSILFRTGEGETEVIMGVGRWNNTSAISTIQFYQATNAYSTGSIFTLYGILRA